MSRFPTDQLINASQIEITNSGSSYLIPKTHKV